MHVWAAVLFVVCVPSMVSAVGPTINANVYDGKPPVLTIVSQQNRAIVNQRNVRFLGMIHNINQLMVYIDGAYSQTVPVDTGSSNYDFLLSLPEGTHTIKLVGLDASSGITIESSIVLTYSPNATPSVGEVVSGTADITKQAVVDSSEYLQDQVNQASSTQPATFLSDTAFTVMNALDLAPATGSEPMPRMMSRFWAVTAGTALILMTHPMITLYHLSRYQLLRWNVHALPMLMRRHAAFVIRAGGTLLLAIGFFI
jgi:hypothetical protein